MQTTLIRGRQAYVGPYWKNAGPSRPDAYSMNIAAETTALQISSQQSANAVDAIRTLRYALVPINCSGENMFSFLKARSEKVDSLGVEESGKQSAPCGDMVELNENEHMWVFGSAAGGYYRLPGDSSNPGKL